MATRSVGRAGLWIVMALVAVGLLGFGTGSFGTSGASIGTVGGEEVSAQAYANRLGQEVRRIEQQLGSPLDATQVAAFGLDQAVLAQLVTERALDAETARLGLSVGDARVAQAVRGSNDFSGLDGSFDRELYREQLRRTGLNEAEYEETLREGTTRTLLQAAVLGGLPEPAVQADAISQWGGERRTVTWATLGTDAVTVAVPIEEEARAYYEAHPDAFTTPELREISYAWLTPQMLAPEIEVDGAEVRALYDERLDQFVQPERRLVERLVLLDDAQAVAARERLDAGEATFDALVAERGLNLADIDLGDVTVEDLDGAGEQVFAAAPGDVVGPLPSPLGPALFRVNAVLAADEVTFEEAEPELRAELADARARDAIETEVATLDDLLAGGATIEDLAEQTRLEAGAISYSEGVTDGIAAYDAFRAAAQAAQTGAFPEVQRLPDGGAFVLRLDSVTPPALRPFEEVAEAATQDARRDALATARAAEAERIARLIAGGASFESLGLEPRVEPDLTRRDVREGTPPGFTETAFGLEVGAAAAMPTAEGGAVVLRVDSSEPPAEDDPATLADRAALGEDLSSSIAADIYAAFAASVQTGLEVRINESAVAGVTAQVRQ